MPTVILRGVTDGPLDARPGVLRTVLFVLAWWALAIVACVVFVVALYLAAWSSLGDEQAPGGLQLLAMIAFVVCIAALVLAGRAAWRGLDSPVAGVVAWSLPVLALTVVIGEL